MNIRAVWLAFVCQVIAAPLLAQPAAKQVTHQQLMWFSYVNALEFSPKWSLVSEVHERRFIDPDRQHQFLLRFSALYTLGENWEAYTGFTYFLQSPNDPGGKDRLTIPELRPHVQLNYRQPLGRFSVTHRYRAERRFFRNSANGELTKGYTANYRFRYRLGLEYHLATISEQPLKLKVNDELHINAGKNITYNRFDQNRIYAGLSYAISKSIDVEAGYLNWYQQRGSGNEFYNRHIISFAINHKIDLSYKNKAAERN